ncbi:hypothetical protein [Actinoplanes sp. NBRC 103695]|uniref:hypothetical protein n=1 Tax=Actinoplanes sp. NBRC 103695 TaxID=3032202 RepID=UPI0024A5D5D6|nr:hypothetical protein [Actinoplanes sp. NBRC 103695]GLY97066.1 hypothetical protein Acsp02_43200 [Actinoplanes sp. NBRC 103695]
MAPRMLERGLTGLFRSRWGVALVLAIIVLAVVGIGRVFSDGSEPDRTPVGAGSPRPTLSVNLDDEDSVISPEPPPQPKTSPGTAQPEAVAYAFAGAWVDHRSVSAKTWRDRLRPNATEELANDLAGTDPEDVPADRVNGQPKLVPIGENLLDAVIETDSGQLTLRLTAPEGRWLVSAIDWNGP